MSTQTMALDVTIDNFGSIILFTPISAAANDWFQENVQCDLTWGGSIPCEPRMAEDLIQGLLDEGFRV